MTLSSKTLTEPKMYSEKISYDGSVEQIDYSDLRTNNWNLKIK
jgi:hypothetical protein